MSEDLRQTRTGTYVWTFIRTGRHSAGWNRTARRRDMADKRPATGRRRRA